MLFKKLGLAQGRTEIFPEVPIQNFTPYISTDYDKNNQYDSYVVMSIDINKRVELKDGVLTIDNKQFDIVDKTLYDIHNIINDNNGSAYFFSGYEELSNLPAILLRNFSNIVVTDFDGSLSPMNVSYRKKNKGIETEKSVDTSIYVIDGELNTNKEFSINGNNIYFNPSKNTKVYITTLSTTFSIKVDFSPKRFITDSTSYLLNFGERI